VDLKRTLHQSWKANAERPFLVEEDQRWTFDQVIRRAVALSRLIIASDRSETGHVGIILPNSEAFVTSFFGCLAADRAAVPVNCLLSPPEAGFILEHGRVKLVLTSSAFRPLIEAIRESGGPAIEAIYLDELAAVFGEEQVHAAVASADPDMLDSGESDPERTACLLYTSGTTDLAKGVILTHGNLVANCESMRQALDIYAEDAFLCVLPLFHSFGMTTTMLLSLVAGSRMVLMRRFHPTTAVDLIEREKVTALLMVAPMFALLMRAASSNPSRLSTVRIAISGGGPLSPALGEAFHKSMGFPVFQGYGLTEAAPVVAVNYPPNYPPASVGPCVPGVRAEIRDENDQPLAVGETGEICVAGENIMRGYYRNPEETAAALDGKGWLRTGDLGYLDDKGVLYVTGRKKDLIIFGGEKIYPQEVEHTLGTHPAIAEVAIVGITDPLRNEYPKAFLVLKEGASIEERELRHWCAERMAGFKVPREFEVLDALPKNTLGKVLKRELAKQSPG